MKKCWSNLFRSNCFGHPCRSDGAKTGLNVALLKNLDVMRCAISYHFYNLKYVQNAHGGVLLLVKLQAKNIFQTDYLQLLLKPLEFA